MREFRELARSAAVLAMGRLGWTPECFWAATPHDLRMALEGSFGPQETPVGRDELELLKERLG